MRSKSIVRDRRSSSVLVLLSMLCVALPPLSISAYADENPVAGSPNATAEHSSVFGHIEHLVRAWCDTSQSLDLLGTIRCTSIEARAKVVSARNLHETLVQRGFPAFVTIYKQDGVHKRHPMGKAERLVQSAINKAHIVSLTWMTAHDARIAVHVE